MIFIIFYPIWRFTFSHDKGKPPTKSRDFIFFTQNVQFNSEFAASPHYRDDDKKVFFVWENSPYQRAVVVLFLQKLIIKSELFRRHSIHFFTIFKTNKLKIANQIKIIYKIYFLSFLSLFFKATTSRTSSVVTNS